MTAVKCSAQKAPFFRFVCGQAVEQNKIIQSLVWVSDTTKAEHCFCFLFSDSVVVGLIVAVVKDVAIAAVDALTT